MEKSPRIAAQVYGYAVCLVAVITFIFATITFINSAVDMGDLSHSTFSSGSSPSLATYENYKLDILKSIQKGDGNTAVVIPDETTLKAMYQAAKDDKLQSVSHSTKKSLIISSTILLISIILFFFHWRWIKKLNRD